MARYGTTDGVFRLLGVDPSGGPSGPPFALFDPIGGLSGVEERLDAYSDWAESKCPANAVPFPAPYPPQLVHIVQMRTAVDIAVSCGLSGFDGLAAREATAIVDFTSFASGIPVRSSGGGRTNLAVVVGESADARRIP